MSWSGRFAGSGRTEPRSWSAALHFVQDHLDRTALVPAMTARISATIEIAAPPEHVWAVLTDLASYGEWNPVFRQGIRAAHPGEQGHDNQHASGDRPHHDRQGQGADRRAGGRARWASSVLGLMTGQHSFILSPTTRRHPARANPDLPGVVHRLSAEVHRPHPGQLRGDQ